MSFEELLAWAEDYKPGSAPAYDAPSLLMIGLGIFIVLLVIWCIVLIFAQYKNKGDYDSDENGDDEGEDDEGEEDDEEDNGVGVGNN